MTPKTFNRVKGDCYVLKMAQTTKGLGYAFLTIWGSIAVWSFNRDSLQISSEYVSRSLLPLYMIVVSFVQRITLIPMAL